MPTRLACISFDADRPRSVADFWAELLGWPVTIDRPGEVNIAAPDPDGLDLTLAFLPARAEKLGKNRVHLDLAAHSAEHQRRLVERALALGARSADIGQGSTPWTVLSDPEGNEFCVLEPREEYLGTGAIAAVVVDTRDPLRLARFWSAASGWPRARHDPRIVGLRSATGLGCWLEFLRHPAPPEHSRLRLDLAAFPLDDPADEAARLCAAGAMRSAVSGRLADPEANEFRLRRWPAP